MTAMKELSEEIAAMDDASNNTDETLVALRADTDGRMTKALTGKTRFNRWGKHYMRAICRSH